MFQHSQKKSQLQAILWIAELLYHATVREVRSSHGNAVIGLALNIMQAMIMLAAFYVMFSVLGLRGSAIRGDFLVYLMTGIFLFQTHNKGLSSVMRSDGPNSPMMKHSPMNTVIAIGASAFGTLYTSILSMMVMMVIYHVAVTPIWMPDPIAAFGMFLLAWASGCAIGLVLKAAKPWAPGIVGVVAMIYMRANMIASGKMFVANTLPSTMLVMFDWNPLFHTIDQARGFAFINYYPHNSDILYPFKVTVIMLVIGMMIEFVTRRSVSISWSAKN